MPNIEVSKDWVDRITAERGRLIDSLDELISAVQDGLRRYAAGDPKAIASNLISATLRQAEQTLRSIELLR